MAKLKLVLKSPPTPPPAKKERLKELQDPATALEKALPDQGHSAQEVPQDDPRDLISMSNAANSPLLRLPAEIRNEIFAWVFCDVKYEIAETYRMTDSVVRLQIAGAYLPDPNPYNFDLPFIKTNDPETLVVLGLLRVCRQIHAEVALLPYSLASFEIIWTYFIDVDEQVQVVERLLKARTKEQVGVMARVVCEEWIDDEEVAQLRVGTGAYWVARFAEASN
ncbi:hypothetical protein J4E89_009081 [Alternaria sp. Ai002NY15]|nr:hypothetical protein J4E89_009081 [Alternaria sp. Ai002NY15]